MAGSATRADPAISSFIATLPSTLLQPNERAPDACMNAREPDDDCQIEMPARREYVQEFREKTSREYRPTRGSFGSCSNGVAEAATKAAVALRSEGEGHAALHDGLERPD